MEANLNKALEIVANHRDEVPGANDSQKNKFLQELNKEVKKIIARTDEDRRLSSQIAIDSSKTFVQIAIAVLVAIGGFYQFGFKNNWDKIPVILLGFAAFLTFISMCCGFIAVSGAFKRGEGIKDRNLPAWSIDAFKISINLQAWTGVLALIVFAFAIVIQSPSISSSYQKLQITFPQNIAKTTTPLKPLKFTGVWSELSVEQQGNFSIKLDSVPTGNEHSFTLEFK